MAETSVRRELNLPEAVRFAYDIDGTLHVVSQFNDPWCDLFIEIEDFGDNDYDSLDSICDVCVLVAREEEE